MPRCSPMFPSVQNCKTKQFSADSPSKVCCYSTEPEQLDREQELIVGLDARLHETSMLAEEDDIVHMEGTIVVEHALRYSGRASTQGVSQTCISDRIARKPIAQFETLELTTLVLQAS